MSGVTVATRRRDDVDIERDRELVERAQSGESDAFGDLYLRYFDRLCRFCVRRLGNVAEAEDAAQEAFAKAWKALDRFDGERRFYPWLSVIAANVCTDIVRRRSRSTPVEEPELDRVVTPLDAGLEAVVERSDIEMIDAALDRISPRHREVLRLREAYEWSYQRIAEYQGVEISTIETLLFRARRALRREFMALAEAQGAAAAVFLVIRRALRPIGRLAHLTKAPQLAKVAKLTAPAGTAEAGAAGGAVSAPALVGAAAGAGAGTAAGVGSAALVAGIVATLVAAGALSAVAVSHGHAPSHPAAATTSRSATTADRPDAAGSVLAPAAAATVHGASPSSTSSGRSASSAHPGHSATSTGSSLPVSAGTNGVAGAASPSTKVAAPITGGLGGATAAVGGVVGSAVTAAKQVANSVTGTVQQVVSVVASVVGGGSPPPTTTSTTTTTTTLLPGVTLP